MNTINYITHENGLVVATDKAEDFESVTLSILVKSGSRNENEQNNGISHFLEHMAFKGTLKRTAKDIAEEFDMIGGYFNAYTSRTSTVYYAKVLKNDLEKALDIITDILLNSTFAKEELEKERQVIFQELCMTKDTPDDIVFDYFQETAFKNQPLGRSILGTEEFIKNLKREELLSYFTNQYSNKNTIISAAGNFNSRQFNDLISNRFVNFQNTNVKKYEKGIYTGGELHVKKDLEQAQFLLGFEGVSYLDKDFYDAQILSIILGGGMSSRLFQEIREKRGLVYNISSYSTSYSDCGIFGVYSALDPVNINILIDLIVSELFNITDKINEKEIMRAKAQIKSSLLMSMESTTARAKKLCNNFAMFGRYISNEEVLEKIDNVNFQSLQKVAKKIISNNNITITTLGNVANIYSYNKIVDKLKL
ncbi:M16 family metallopeptidase [Rickettsiales endosymbiont of Trichoplax sp. H2]|uniref:M16 family metallopeptidase n=1 Tax=Rickettsiales endosymbiont of Trichoplax sp. H2 TaxID=2021221 RepID=UPI0012B3E0C7|nr:pitrilysin family protein [Rickettsiales endosymbiont of Trichoplax sp. H2]MSO13380.1 putative zinc protease [Rickettsiales endosymbiont of Trichoplax sp. H2]